jgi:hypothetical protein
VNRSKRADALDGSGFWLAMAGVFAALGIGGMTIAVTEYHPPWTSAWFITAAVLSAPGCVCAIWSLTLFLARNQVADQARNENKEATLEVSARADQSQQAQVVREMRGGINIGPGSVVHLREPPGGR